MAEIMMAGLGYDGINYIRNPKRIIGTGNYTDVTDGKY